MPNRQTSILAKDIIADAKSLVNMEDTRLQTEAIGRNYYNSALLEVYMLLSYVDKDSMLGSDVLSSTNNICDISSITDYDKIETVLIAGKDIEFSPISLTDFLRFERKGLVGFPHSESGVYTILGNQIKFLIGKDVAKLTNPDLTVYYTELPTYLTKDVHNTLMLDLPMKYYPLIVNRIASYYELSLGKDERFMMLFKTGVELLTATLDSSVQNKLLQSLELRTNYNKDNQGIGT
jgi:hypothetical protein